MAESGRNRGNSAAGVAAVPGRVARVPEPAVRLVERDSFGAAESYFPSEVRLLPVALHLASHSLLQRCTH